ncbi:thioredoxin-like domain-containing protein, partial [Rhodonellum sp.]|uniref:TlpA family protein disulfide reductase n=1 Tax=Rhodonellum sp. TaxID=2231180 RepID=UPI00272798C0
SYTPSRGHRLSDLRAVAYIGRRVPCLLRILHRIAKGMALFSKEEDKTNTQSILIKSTLLTLKAKTIFFILASLFVFTGQSIAQQKVAVHPGAESADSVPTGVGELNAIAIYGEIKGGMESDLVELRLWDHMILENKEIPSPQKSILKTDDGNIFDGSLGLRTFEVGFESPEIYPRLTLLINGKVVINNFLIVAGSRLRIRIDMESHSIQFGGNAKNLFDAQLAIHREFDTKSFNTSPVVVTDNPEKAKSSPKFGPFYQQALAKKSDLRLLMNFISPGALDESYVNDLLENSPFQHEAMKILGFYESTLKTDVTKILRADILGKASLPLFINFQRIFQPKKELFECYQKKVLPLVEFEQLPEYAYSPSYVHARLEAIRTQHLVENIPFYSLIDSHPPKLRDGIYARYVLDNYMLMEETAGIFEVVNSTIETAWIKDILTELLEVRVSGRPVLEGEFFNAENKKINLSSYRGKTVLLSFWITGCRFCAFYNQNILKPLHAKLENNPNYVLVTINADRDFSLYQSSLESEKYTPPSTNNHWIGDMENEFLKTYQISSFPYKMIIDPDQKIFMSTVNARTPEEFLVLLEKANSTKSK